MLEPFVNELHGPEAYQLDGKSAIAYTQGVQKGLEASQLLFPHDNIGHFVIGSEITIADYKSKNLELDWQLKHDSLTGLFNEAGLMSEAIKLINTPGVLFLIADLTNFKAVNDKYGHQVGDKLLVEAGNVLVAATRADTDIIARLHGDEFAGLIDTKKHGNNRRHGDMPLDERKSHIKHRVETEMNQTLLKYPNIKSLGFHIAVGIVPLQESYEESLRLADRDLNNHKQAQHEKLGKYR